MKDITPYELAKIISDVVRYQQNELDTYKIIVVILCLVIWVLLCQCVKLWIN
jgi:hypothetical protein